MLTATSVKNTIVWYWQLNSDTSAVKEISIGTDISGFRTFLKFIYYLTLFQIQVLINFTGSSCKIHLLASMSSSVFAVRWPSIGVSQHLGVLVAIGGKASIKAEHGQIPGK